MVAITLQFVLVSIALATASALAAPSAANDQGGQTYQAPSIIPAAWKSVGDVSVSVFLGGESNGPSLRAR